MHLINYDQLLKKFIGASITKPASISSSGHASGTLFEQFVYDELKNMYPENTYKQFEFLNTLYTENPNIIDLNRYDLIPSKVLSFLLKRGKDATKKWSVNNMFSEKQNDTADTLMVKDGFYEIMDVKSISIDKKGQPPNIISSRKLADMCKLMIDHNDFDKFTIYYIGIYWEIKDDKMYCTNAKVCNLFKIDPEDLYINWTSATQIQFHISDVKQDYTGSTEDWAKKYLENFTKSAKKHILNVEKCINKYI